MAKSPDVVKIGFPEIMCQKDDSPNDSNWDSLCGQVIRCYITVLQNIVEQGHSCQFFGWHLGRQGARMNNIGVSALVYLTAMRMAGNEIRLFG